MSLESFLGSLVFYEKNASGHAEAVVKLGFVRNANTCFAPIGDGEFVDWSRFWVIALYEDGFRAGGLSADDAKKFGLTREVFEAGRK